MTDDGVSRDVAQVSSVISLLPQLLVDPLEVLVKPWVTDDEDGTLEEIEVDRTP